MLESYQPIFLFLMVVIGFAALMFLMAGLFGPRVFFKEKMDPYECGLPSKGSAYQRSSIKYYLVAVLFILFDVEVAFMYPWAANFKSFGWSGLGVMGIFLLLLILGFLYEWKKGLLDWK